MRENKITMDSDGIIIDGHIGTWYVIDEEYVIGGKIFLLEHEEYGDETANIIINEDGELLMEDVWNGFDDYNND